MPYLHLLSFLFSKKYGEGEMSQVVIFVSVYYLFAILIFTYYLSSGIRLIIINNCFVWRHLASFRLTSFLVPCLLLVLKGFPLQLIFRFINTSFHIHFIFFIDWKQNIIIIHPTFCRWSADLLDVNLVKEYKLGGCQ